MSYYVHRAHPITARQGWVGPIRSRHQAEREATAWSESGWTAEIHESSCEIREAVRAWMRRVREERAS